MAGAPRPMVLIRSLHAWAGLLLCLLIAAIALSGTLLTARPLWRQLAYAEQARPWTAPDAAGLGREAERVAALFAGEVRGLRPPDPDFAGWEVMLKDGGGALVDAETLAVVSRWDRGGTLMDWLFQLHHYLLLGKGGELVVGTLGLTVLVFIGTGIALWTSWPGRHSYRPWPKTGRRRGLLDWHRDFGTLLTPLLLLTAITGVSLCFGPAARAILGVLPAGSVVAAPPPAPASPGPGWAAATAEAMRQFPAASIRRIGPAPDGVLTFRLRQPAEWHPNGRTVVRIDTTTGTLLERTDALAQPRGERIYNTVYPLHGGFVGGLPWRLAIGLTGLVLAGLSLTGGWCFLKMQLSRRQAVARRVKAGV
ncbi:PepSY-associated TM helix domain-containing protein [Oleisolibacter albus]|uniref:PepSY-associated TM helix domain-containing protein n=1 Tax=Oleisolibacter albus TaxID=2171757 RepID=UPI000DF2834D|nr:PepSY-associated TM helix domain-containing protein [Oleisolibacter albus]